MRLIILLATALTAAACSSSGLSGSGGKAADGAKTPAKTVETSATTDPAAGGAGAHPNTDAGTSTGAGTGAGTSGAGTGGSTGATGAAGDIIVEQAPSVADDGFVAPGTTYTAPKCAHFTGIRTQEGVLVDGFHGIKVATCNANERVISGFCQCHQGATWVRGNSGANGWACACNQNPELVAARAVCLQCAD